MAFYESPRFPERISFGAIGGAGYLTDVTIVASGAEFRNAAWSQARMTWDVAHAARRQPDYELLAAFFRTMRGRLHGFRFKDWTDFTVTGSAGILTATGVTDEYQMFKRYTSGSQTEDRLISKPVAGSFTIAGVGTYTTVTTTGKVTRTGGAAPTGWSGQFDVPCRFDTDAMRGEIIDKSPGSGEFIMGWESIPIIELRV
jgi:uncharacterized protein (TIGR02217 family)